ncbi:MAG: hypothetical protein M3T49_10220 [Candidatus Eremiobacteraeota bacterium]|nr:hypothetical protein [Candidatus Eremiobacteraeota bacterium]
MAGAQTPPLTLRRALCCLSAGALASATLLPASAAQTDVPPLPLVTNISGVLMLRSPHQAAHDVASSHLLHRGDVVMTGIDGLAAVSLFGVGKVRLGPGTTAQVLQLRDRLSIHLTSGSLCVQADAPRINIVVARVVLRASTAGTGFKIENRYDGAKLAIDRGLVTAIVRGKPVGTIKAGDSVALSSQGDTKKIPSSSIERDFAALHCSQDTVVAQLPQPAAPTQSSGRESGGGGGAGILGLLLGVAAIGAAAGHGGGGGGGGSAPAPAFGNLTLSLSALSFAGPRAPPQSLTAQESNYFGPLSASAPNCASIAAVSPQSGSGPSATFQVSPQGVGTCTLSIKDNHSAGSSVAVTVYGALTVDRSSLTFTDIGPANSQQFSVQEPQYGGPVSQSSNCTNVALITPAEANSPATFSVTPVGSGTCTITLTDNHGGAVTESISVGPFGPVTPSSGSIALLVGRAQPLSATETNYTGSFSVDSSACAGIAAVSGTSPNFAVTGVAIGTCTLTINDDHGGSAGVAVFVLASGSAARAHRARSNVSSGPKPLPPARTRSSKPIVQGGRSAPAHAADLGGLHRGAPVSFPLPVSNASPVSNAAALKPSPPVQAHPAITRPPKPAPPHGPTPAPRTAAPPPGTRPPP